MREIFSKTIDDKRVTVSDGSFTETGIPDGWADLITVAQVSLPNYFTTSFSQVNL